MRSIDGREEWVESLMRVVWCAVILGELPQLNDGNFLLPRDGILMHLQTVGRRLKLVSLWLQWVTC